MSKSLFRQKWFVYLWPFIMLLLCSVVWAIFAILIFHSDPVFTWNMLLGYFIIITMESFYLFGLFSVFMFTLSLLWWLRRPGWSSLLFSLFVVCFVINGPGYIVYAFGGYARYSYKLEAWFVNLLGL
jgi:hypothetical protein